jgi:hypothetical protein
MLGLPNEADAVRDTWLLLSRSAAGEQSARDVPPVLESLARSRRKYAQPRTVTTTADP